MPHVPSATALSLIRSRGSLSRVARTAFTIAWYDRPRSVFANERGVLVHLDVAGLLKLPKERGPNLHTLHMRAPFPFNEMTTRRIITQCTGLRSFSYKPCCRLA